VRKDDKKLYCSKRKKRSTEKGVGKEVKKELRIEKRALLREENEGRLESTNSANECLVRGKVNPFFHFLFASSLHLAVFSLRRAVASGRLSL